MYACMYVYKHIHIYRGGTACAKRGARPDLGDYWCISMQRHWSSLLRYCPRDCLYWLPIFVDIQLIRTHTYTYIHIYTCTHTYMYICICMYIYIPI